MKQQQDMRHAQQVRADEPCEIERRERALSGDPSDQAANGFDRKLVDGELEYVVGGFLRACLPTL